MVKTFVVEGKFLNGQKLQKFSKEVKALKEEHALEEIYAIFGSKHRVKRSEIIVEKVGEKDE